MNTIVCFCEVSVGEVGARSPFRRHYYDGRVFKVTDHHGHHDFLEIVEHRLENFFYRVDNVRSVESELKFVAQFKLVSSKPSVLN